MSRPIFAMLRHGVDLEPLQAGLWETVPQASTQEIAEAGYKAIFDESFMGHDQVVVMALGKAYEAMVAYAAKHLR